MADLLAWYVWWGYLDEEETPRAIIFATSLEDAQAKGSQALGEFTPYGCPAEDEVSAERHPSCDKYAPGPMTLADYLAEGWSWTCHFAECDHPVSEEGCSSCNDEDRPTCEENDIPWVEPVVEAERVFCSAEHRDAEAERRRLLSEERANLLAEFNRRWASATVEHVWVGPAPRFHRGVDFRFPGGSYPARWDDFAGKVIVDQRDLVAWHDFDRHSKAGRPCG